MYLARTARTKTTEEQAESKIISIKKKRKRQEKSKAKQTDKRKSIDKSSKAKKCTDKIRKRQGKAGILGLLVYFQVILVSV